MMERLKGWFAPPYSQLTGLVSALLAVAGEFTDPNAFPALVGVFGPTWTKQLVAVCVLVVLVSKAIEKGKKP